MTGRKVQIAFSARELTMLEMMRPRPIAAAVRDALRFYDWCRRQTADGWTIVAIKGERMREPVLAFDTLVDAEADCP